MKTRHGFLAAGVDEMSAALFVDDIQHYYRPAPSCPEALTDCALQTDLTHLWILPSYGYHPTLEEAQRTRQLHPESGNYEIKMWTPIRQPELSHLIGKRLAPEASRGVEIAWLKGWKLAPDVPQLQRAFADVEETLGVAMRGHAGVMGLDFLRKTDEKYYYRYFRSPHLDLDILDEVGVSPLAHFPATPEELLKDEAGNWLEYLYCYDRNSSHPYAASQLKFGIGAPQLLENIKFDHLAPGFWQADIIGYEKLWNWFPLLPARKKWLGTPILKMAQQRGCEIRVRQAYIWPDKENRAPVFNRWAHDLWGLREHYEKGSPEREVVKSIMNQTIGLQRKTRPDWYGLTLSEERAVVWLKAWQVAQATGRPPIGVYHDALYIPGNAPLELLTTHKKGQNLEHSLGGYKIEWRLPLCPEVRAILIDASSGNASNKIGLLKKWGRENGYNL